MREISQLSSVKQEMVFNRICFYVMCGMSVNTAGYGIGADTADCTGACGVLFAKMPISAEKLNLPCKKTKNMVY